MLDSIDRMANDPSYGVRRGRPVRKEDPEPTFVGTKAALDRIAELSKNWGTPQERAAADELTAQLQEMEARDGVRSDEQ